MKLVCHVGNSNIAIGSLPTLQISLVIVPLFEKIYYEFRFIPSSQISGRMYNTDVSIKCMMGKTYRSPSPTLCRYRETKLLFADNTNRVRGAVLGLSQVGACTDLFENLSVNSLKGDLSNTTSFKPPIFSLD